MTTNPGAGFARVVKGSQATLVPQGTCGSTPFGLAEVNPNRGLSA